MDTARGERRTRGLLATAGAALAALLGLLAIPIGVGLGGGALVAASPLGIAAVIVLAAAAAVWWARAAMAAMWWARYGEWDWRRTALRRSVPAWWRQ